MSIGTVIDSAIDAVGNALHPAEAEAEKLFEEAKTSVEGEAVKVEAVVLAFAEHEAVKAKLALGKEKIAALDELHKLNSEALAFLETEKTRALGEVSALKTKVETLLATL